MLGCDRGDEEKLVLRLVPGLDIAGVERAGDMALRKSVYAVGGVIGVFMSSSCLMTWRRLGTGLLGNGLFSFVISDGKDEFFGVLS